MTDKEIVQALRCEARHKTSSNVGCKKCPYWEPEGLEEWQKLHGWTACKVYQIISDAADAIEQLLAENAALREKAPQWISVRDRLPEVWKNEKDDVLVNYMIYSPDFGVDIGNYHATAKRWLCMSLPCTVTHWMPLPEGPEEGDKSDA